MHMYAQHAHTYVKHNEEHNVSVDSCLWRQIIKQVLFQLKMNVIKLCIEKKIA